MNTSIEELLKRPFIKLRSDYGFKRVFGRKESASVLKSFLNALFEGKMVITDVLFQDKEVLPPDKNGKRIVYDAYCTTTTGYHFIVEMQQAPSIIFGKRMVIYISSCIYRQAERGGTYKFEPVYLIVITDFDMQPLEKQLVNEVVLMERNTHTVYTEDFKIFFLSLKQVSDEWEKCNTELERQLYLIKNMENLNKESASYRSGRYQDMFDASELSSMVNEEVVEYKRSMWAELEHESALEFAKAEALAEGEARGEAKGFAKGEAKGFAKGEANGIVKVAKTMKLSGEPIQNIMKFTNLTEQQIEEL